MSEQVRVWESARDFIAHFERCQAQGHTLSYEEDPKNRRLGFFDESSSWAHYISLGSLREANPLTLAEQALARLMGTREGRRELLTFSPKPCLRCGAPSPSYPPDVRCSSCSPQRA
jgi:hypothetical protein